MKKIFLIFAVVIGFLLTFNATVLANKELSTDKVVLNLKLDLDEKLVEINKDLRIKSKENKKLNIDFTNPVNIQTTKGEKNNKLHLELDLKSSSTSSSDVEVTGQSFLQLNGEKYLIKQEGMLEVETVNDHDIYKGLLYVDVFVENKAVPGAIKVWFTKNKNDGFASLSVGSLDKEEGITFLKFGKPSEQQVQLMKEERELQRHLDQISGNEESSQNKDFTIAAVNKEFKYETSGYSSTYSSSMGSGTASEKTAIVDVFAREPRDLGQTNGEVTVRVLPNIDAIHKIFAGQAYYLQSSVESVALKWGWSSRDVATINNAYPLTSSNGDSLSTAWDIVSSLNQNLNPLWSIGINFLLGSTNGSWEINDNGDIFTNRAKKNFYGLKNVKTLPTYSNYYDSEKISGGVYSSFLITSRGSYTWQNTAEAEVVYNVHWVEFTNTFPLRSGKAITTHYINGK